MVLFNTTFQKINAVTVILDSIKPVEFIFTKENLDSGKDANANVEVILSN